MKYLDDTNAAGEAQPSRSAEFADIIWLHMHSERHRHIALADLDWRVLSALRLGQFQLFHKEDRPYAYASWARVTPEVRLRLQGTRQKLEPEEWACGSKVVLMDLVSPFCEEGVVLEKLRSVLHQGQNK